ncbi:iron-dicitrate transporter ATP-binding subunit [Leucobacter sp. OLIS6]|uniref:ABC transporter ATP-binding protein n=3 Tax=Leucobacter TaxID=55968 RepID=UPI000C1954DA|nr:MULTISPECIES: ABC transporter ATP-binding protein [unclassified Leucobacter]PII88181.1 iron-dicitrate transporter ATP-binding subunit [Leucobacter sp. OLCALW19]PII94228.1 iron-dicitrate transporter ATP-binding subunit [Leucobacter sp. OLAS13]PII96380.1 iron-dicitrate transporter ATP-binding subunit [Leucobacter sp. OLTLW20]PII98200.1 iron-dicitrate transporter ATP-binding subunit [Leucobacter sp. OLDS2]PIJ03531.1 iron-dicitrate transporter ATP-binding subunit [Leucobacter sp. OLIS6]
MTFPRTSRSAPELATADLTLRYGDRTVVSDLELVLPSGGFTVIIGPNGCGKSTLLRSLARAVQPSEGTVSLDGRDLASFGRKDLAKRIGILAQSPVAPAAITVADLVARGRHPHQSLLRQWSRADESAVASALAEVGMEELSDRLVEELSGGQRQRAWIAMALAQETPLLLLDEPTTYLDIAHQIEVLDLLSRLHADGRTLVAVLHDLNLAARYASHIVAMRDGVIAAQGSPAEVITPDLLRRVFDLDALVLDDPETGAPLIVPRDRRGGSRPPVPIPEPDRGRAVPIVPTTPIAAAGSAAETRSIRS